MPNLTVEVYNGTSRIPDPGEELGRAEDLEFGTALQGGLYLDAKMKITRPLLRWWALNGAQRMVIRHMQQAVYEGVIDNLNSRNEEGGQVLIRVVGQWGAVMKRRLMRRWWIDRRLDSRVWEEGDPAGDTCRATITRRDDSGACISIQPTNQALWNNNDVRGVTYKPPTGEAVKRMVFDYNLTTVGTEKWTLTVKDVQNNSVLFSVSRTTAGTTSGTGQVVTLSPTSNNIIFRITANQNQTPAQSGGTPSIYSFAKLSNLTMYAATANSGNYADTMSKLALDMANYLSLNSDVSRIATPGTPYTLPQFIGGDNEYAGDALVRAVRYGDGNYNPYIAALVCSELATTPDGKPVLSLQAMQALTDYDYVLSMDEATPSVLDYDQDFGGIWNWISASYTDENGVNRVLNPLDDAALKDAGSITAWGQRDMALALGTTTSAAAKNFAVRYLGDHKNPQYSSISPLTVKGYLRKKNGDRAHTSRVAAGSRLLIDNYPTSAGMIVMITQTKYQDPDESVQMNFGTVDTLPNQLAAMMAQIKG